MPTELKTHLVTNKTANTCYCGLESFKPGFDILITVHFFQTTCANCLQNYYNYVKNNISGYRLKNNPIAYPKDKSAISILKTNNKLLKEIEERMRVLKISLKIIKEYINTNTIHKVHYIKQNSFEITEDSNIQKCFCGYKINRDINYTKNLEKVTCKKCLETYEDDQFKKTLPPPVFKEKIIKEPKKEKELKKHLQPADSFIRISYCSKIQNGKLIFVNLLSETNCQNCVKIYLKKNPSNAAALKKLQELQIE